MNKIKEKIEKLLNLSMSDNENEASIALEKALKLMNEHNITKDEVYRQNFISKKFEIDNKTLPDWKSTLYTAMSNISGCIFTWKNGFRYSLNEYVKVQAQITGRERDVENAVYLCVFLEREIKKREAIKRKELKAKGIISHEAATYLKSFKKGIITVVAHNIYHQQNSFFNKNIEKGLVLLPIQSKLDEARKFLNEETTLVKSASKVSVSGELDGLKTGNTITINHAVAKQEDIKVLA